MMCPRCGALVLGGDCLECGFNPVEDAQLLAAERAAGKPPPPARLYRDGILNDEQIRKRRELYRQAHQKEATMTETTELPKPREQPTISPPTTIIGRLRADRDNFLREVAELGPMEALKRRGIHPNNWSRIAKALAIPRPSRRESPSPAATSSPARPNPCLHCEALAQNIRLRDGIRRLSEIIHQAEHDLARTK